MVVIGSKGPMDMEARRVRLEEGWKKGGKKRNVQVAPL